jgi:hypothetical protein
VAENQKVVRQRQFGGPPVLERRGHRKVSVLNCRVFTEKVRNPARGTEYCKRSAEILEERIFRCARVFTPILLPCDRISRLRKGKHSGIDFATVQMVDPDPAPDYLVDSAFASA